MNARTPRAVALILLAVPVGALVGCGILAGYDFSDYGPEPNSDGGGGRGTSSSSSSTSEVATSSASSGAGGSDGGLEAGPCGSASDCPTPADTCTTPVCNAGVCGSNAAMKSISCFATGNPLLASSCDGAGNCVGKPLWSKRFGDTGEDVVNGIVVDAAGDLVVAGNFEKTIAFAPIATLSTDPDGGDGGIEEDGFIAKLSSDDGHAIWAIRATNGAQVKISSVAVDAMKNVIVGGSVQGDTIAFGGTPVDATKDPLGALDYFIAKLGPDSKPIWAHRLTGGLDQDPFVGHQRVAVDASGAVFFSGTFLGMMDFGNGVPALGKQFSGFLVKYDASGAFVWSKIWAVPGTFAQKFRGLAIDNSGDVLLTGSLDATGSVDQLDAGENCGSMFNTESALDVFLAQFNGATGHCIQLKSFGQSGKIQTGEAIAVGKGNEIVLGGEEQGTFSFDGKPVDGGAQASALIARPVEGAQTLWADVFGPAVGQSVGDVAVDGDGDIIATGSFQVSIDFGLGPITGQTNSLAFLTKFGASGVAEWNHAFGDGSGAYGSAIAVDGARAIYVAGSFAGNADFGQGSLSSAGEDDIFIAKFAP